MENRLKAFLVVSIASALFSSKAILIKLAYPYQVSPITLLALRKLSTLPVYLTLFVMLQRKTKVFSLSTYIKIVTLGVIGYYIASYLDFIGLQYISAGLERMILYLYPSFVVLLSVIFCGKKPNTKTITALVLSYIGIMCIYYGDIDDLGSERFFGTLCVFLSCLLYALYLLFSEKIIDTTGSAYFTALVMTVSCVCVLIHCYITEPLNFESISNEVYIIGINIGLVCTVIPSFLMNWGIQKLGAIEVSVCSMLGPLSTLLLGFIVLGENITLIEGIGVLLILISIPSVFKKKS